MEQKKGNENKVVSQVDQESNIDASLIEFNLSLSAEERLINHQRALDTVNELIKARKQIYGESKISRSS